MQIYAKIAKIERNYQRLTHYLFFFMPLPLKNRKYRGDLPKYAANILPLQIAGNGD